MATGDQLHLLPEDDAVLAAFAQKLGITKNILLGMLAHASADHLRQHGTLPMPITLGLPSPHCHTCPHGSQPPAPPARPSNVISMN